MPEEMRLVRRVPTQPIPTFRDVLMVAFRQRTLLMTSFILVFLAVFCYGLLSPSYQSQMKVLVRRGRIDAAASPTPTQSPQFDRGTVAEEELNSEVELLRDQDVLRMVVQDSGLAENESRFRHLFGQSKEQRVARAVRKLSSELSADPVRKSNVITVTYASSNPERSARVLRCLSSAYLGRHSQVHRPSGESDFFAQQVVQAKQTLDDAEFQLMNFTREEGVVSAALERDITLQKLSEVDASDHQTRVALAETAQRIRTLERKLPSIPERTTTQVRNLDNAELMGKMKSRLLDLQLQRAELIAKYSASYRLVQELDQQIANTKESITTEDHTPLRDQTTEPDPNHQWAAAELVKAQVDLNGLLARAKSTSLSLANYRLTARQLGDRAIQQDDLLRKLKTAEDNYLLYTNKREEARIGDALDQGGILNVTIAEQPVVPALPLHSVWSFGAIGMVIAGALSTGTAFAVDCLSPAFRTPDEVLAYLGAPVLASLPQRSS